jgi:hypothetical protein
MRCHCGMPGPVQGRKLDHHVDLRARAASANSLSPNAENPATVLERTKTAGIP